MDKDLHMPISVVQENTQILSWLPPRRRHVKLNIDGSFVIVNGSVATCMVLRGSKGEIIFTACGHLISCKDELETKLCAISEGVSLSLQRRHLPLIIESDCLEAINLLTNRMKHLID